MLKKKQNDNAGRRYMSTMAQYRRALGQNPALTLNAYCKMRHVYCLPEAYTDMLPDRREQTGNVWPWLANLRNHISYKYKIIKMISIMPFSWSPPVIP